MRGISGACGGSEGAITDSSLSLLLTSACRGPARSPHSLSRSLAVSESYTHNHTRSHTNTHWGWVFALANTTNTPSRFFYIQQERRQSWSLASTTRGQHVCVYVWANVPSSSWVFALVRGQRSQATYPRQSLLFMQGTLGLQCRLSGTVR